MQVALFFCAKGGTGKTTTAVNLGIGLANQGKKVLLVDADPQGDLTTSLGWMDGDSLSVTLATQMKKVICDEPLDVKEGILHHEEGVDVIPSNIELSSMEMSLINAMSREFTMKTYLNGLKKDYSHIIIDCMPSLAMLTINATRGAGAVAPCAAGKDSFSAGVKCANAHRKKGKRTHIFLDEFHVVFENEYSGNFFNSAWRRFRKRNAFPNAITQNVEYLLDSVLASTMLSNSEYVVMLNQAASDRQKLAELLNISYVL